MRIKMGDFLILAVIITIVCIAIESDQKKKKRKYTRKTGYQNRSNADTYSKRMQGNRTNPQRVSPQGSYQNTQQKQQELKARLMQRYGEALQSYGSNRAGDTVGKRNTSRSNSQSDIFSLSEPHSFGGPGESSELMRQVTDLIIMGYQPQLSGERDFVAEGIEMIHDFDGAL